MLNIIITFIIGVVVGFVGSWFVWKNNKNKWASIENKYKEFTVSTAQTKDIWKAKSSKPKSK